MDEVERLWATLLPGGAGSWEPSTDGVPLRAGPQDELHDSLQK